MGIKASAPDNIYAERIREISKFQFDESVVSVFPDMIRRSVPGYAAIISMIGILAEKHAAPGSNCYDLGCSLGAATLSMRHHIPHKDCRIIGIDNSPSMIDHCRQIVAGDDASVPVSLLCEDLRQTSIENASMVVLNFTLQFIAPADRKYILDKIYAGMRPGAVLVLSEKIAFADPHLDALYIEMHHHFKRANGYSELEISQKRTALENVLLPETLEMHQQRISGAGFRHSDVWFQCFNFVSILAIK